MFLFADPCHPGSFIRDEILTPRDLNVTHGAVALGVTRPALSAVLNQRADLSAEMALRIEKAFGVSMEIMLGMQLAFNVAQMRKRAKSIHVKKWQAMKAKRRTEARRSDQSSSQD
jgi:antitoxin HigA-1